MIDERKERKKKINDTKSQRIKNQLQTRYSTLVKEVKRKTKADKRAFIENLADEAEMAAQMQNMATLYKITKALAGGFRNCDIPMKDADGVLIMSVEEQTQLWKTHFETILNIEAPKEVEDIPERNCKRSEISNRQHEVMESARSRWHKCRDAESGRRRHHRNPYRDFQGNMGRRRNTRRLENRTYR